MKFKVSFLEEIVYEIIVEADNEVEAENIAEDKFVRTKDKKCMGVVNRDVYSVEIYFEEESPV